MPAPSRSAGIPASALLPALQLFKGDGQAGLAGSQGRLFLFQGPDLINQPGTILLGHTSGQSGRASGQSGRASRAKAASSVAVA